MLLFFLQSASTGDFGDCGAAGGIFPPTWRCFEPAPEGSICQGLSLGTLQAFTLPATLRRPLGRPGRGEEYVSLQTPLIRILYWFRQCFLFAAEIGLKCYTNSSISLGAPWIISRT